MARKAIVDRDVMLSMLRDGEPTRSIAEKFNVTRQAIDLHRRDFIEKGLLSNQRALRTRKAPVKPAPPKQNLVSPDLSAPARQTSPLTVTRSSGLTLPSKGELLLDQQIDLIISAFNALKRLPQLEKELEKYKQEYASALHEMACLKENEKKRLDQESRWLRTQHHNDTNSD